MGNLYLSHKIPANVLIFTRENETRHNGHIKFGVDAILIRDVLWSIQGTKHGYLKAAIIVEIHHAEGILRKKGGLG